MNKRPPEHGKYNTYVYYGCRCDPCRAANREHTAEFQRRARAGLVTPAEHGTASTYTNYGCRCDPCSAAQSDKNRSHRQRRLERAREGDPAVPHGTRSGYNGWGCRCDLCYLASRNPGAGPDGAA